MATGALMIGWGAAVRGREKKALQVFNEAIQYYTRLQQQGTIESLSVISGHPLLNAAALEAVSQWKYRPYLLNDEPVEVETYITVTFTKVR